MYTNVVVVAHRRSGTHLAVDSIRNNSEVYGRDPASVDQLTIDHLRRGANPHVSLREFQQNLTATPHVFKSHAHVDLASYWGDAPEAWQYLSGVLPQAKIIYVYRDGRDVMASLYHYCCGFMPEVARMSFSDFLRMDNDFDSETYPGRMSRVEYWAYHVGGWLARPDVLHVSFRQLRHHFEQTFRAIAGFIGLPEPVRVSNVVRAQTAAGRVWRAVHNQLRFPFNRISHSSVSFRRGTVGDSRSLFTREDHRYFNSIAGPLLLRMGLKLHE